MQTSKHIRIWKCIESKTMNTEEFRTGDGMKGVNRLMFVTLLVANSIKLNLEQKKKYATKIYTKATLACRALML